jgi:hypothetical protein
MLYTTGEVAQNTSFAAPRLAEFQKSLAKTPGTNTDVATVTPQNYTMSPRQLQQLNWPPKKIEVAPLK